MFTIEQLRARYSVTSATILGWIRDGHLKAVQVGRKINSRKPRWRVSEKAVEEFEQLRSNKPPAIPPGRPRKAKSSSTVIEFIK